MANEKSSNIVVAIDKDKNSQSALKWAVDHLSGKGKHVTLVHVKQKAPLLTSGTNMQFSSMNMGVVQAYKSEADSQLKELLLPFRIFCTRKNLVVTEVILEDSDVVKALIDYIKENAVENMVLGATARGVIAKKFMSLDVSGGVSKGAPDFCNVYVINKGKINTVKTATTLPPGKSTNSLPPSSQHITPQPSSTPAFSAHSYQGNGVRDKSPISTRSQIDDKNKIKSPFARHTGMFDDLSASNYDISFVTPPRTQEAGFKSRQTNSETDSALFGSVFTSGRLPNNRLGALTPSPQGGNGRSSGAVSPDSNDSFGRFSSNLPGVNAKSGASSDGNYSFGNNSASSFESNERSSTSPQQMDELEAEMRRLKNELKQTMDMYSSACKEAITAKQKASEIELWKTEEQEKVGKARLAEEMALAIAERERAKCKAALEAAEAAQKIAELEAQKRMQAEMKADKEAEEKKKMLNTVDNSEGRYRKYTIEEIETATENFSATRKIGEGGYGPVYKCNLDHTPVAIKVLRPDAAQGESQFRQEIEVLSSIRHPNMVLLLGACPDYGCLVYEYMGNGSLEDCIFHKGKQPVLPWQYRFRIAAEVATALLFLHQAKPEPLVHRDLKPGNILLDRNYVSKISDVGLARLVPPSVADSVTQYHMTSAAGTFCYIDPEYQQTGMLGTKSDIYSFGVMLLQIITARPPMALTHHVERAIQRGTFAEMLDPAIKDWPVEEAMNYAKLALKCTELRKKDRPDLGQEILPELNRLRDLAEQTMPHL